MFYLIGINLITFVFYGIDKANARNRDWRIPENTLLLFAAIGGSIGAFIGMHFFHHKTKKTKFTLGIPLIMIIQVIVYKFIL